MAENTENIRINARIFIEMQSADAIRQQMRQGILDRFRESRFGKALGHMHDTALGGMRDAYRRVFEQGFWGKDVFDGRWHMDNQVGQSGIHGMDRQYDQRASFYGWDQSKEDGKQAPAMQPDPMEKAREMDQGIGR